MALKFEDYRDGTWAALGKNGAVYTIRKRDKSKYAIGVSGKRKWRGLPAYSSLAKAKAAIAQADKATR